MATATNLSRLDLSEISPEVIQSEIRAMSVECDQVGGINLAQGICDTPVPDVVREAAHNAIESGLNTYTRLDGIAPLRAAIAEKLERDNGLTYDPNREVLVTSGATGAMFATCLALLNPGDEVIVFEPYYGYHLNTLRALRFVPTVVPLAAPDWQLDREAVARAVTARTRAIILNTPSNPAGKVFSRSELEFVADFAEEHDLFVFTDEMYEYFLFDGARHVSPATLAGMRERTITISGFSKTFSVTGWRLGYLAASSRWVPAIGYFHDLTYVCAPGPLQHGVTAGLNQLPPSYYSGLASEYQVKRDKLCDALVQAGLTPSIPRGAYYVLADATNVPGANAKEKARTLLRQTGVAAVAGSAFFSGERGENILRFCFAKTAADLDQACKNLRNSSFQG